MNEAAKNLSPNTAELYVSNVRDRARKVIYANFGNDGGNGSNGGDGGDGGNNSNNTNGGNDDNSVNNGGVNDPNKSKNPDDLEKKAATILKNVPRIQLKEYKNVPGFSKSFVENCEYAVASKQSVQDYSNDKTDIFQKASEPLMTMFLGGEGRPTTFLKENGSYAIWASKYDDEKRGTDIIYGIKNGKDWITCSIDVAAPKNDTPSDDINKHIGKKFDNGSNGAYSSMKDFDPWQQEIVFCRRGKQRFTEKKAPHFVLALSNESFKEMTAATILDKDGQVVGCNPNKDLEFMVGSEILVEVNMQLARIGGKNAKKSDYRDTLRALKKIMLTRLADNLDCKVGSEEFAARFNAKAAEMRQKDSAYRSVVGFAHAYKKDYEEVLAGTSLRYQ